MEENKITKSNKIKIIIITALIFLVAIAGISYAYFSIQIVGNETASSMRVTTANMALTYNDVEIASDTNVEPGTTITKELTVTNTGNVTVHYNIIWRELYNEITNNELTISATCASTPTGSCSGITGKIVTTEVPQASNVPVKNNISIAPGVTHTYQVTVEFIETGSNQNYNQNKQFHGTLNISEGTSPRALRAGDEITYGSEHFYVVSTDATNTVLLAKYNLLVGDTFNNSTVVYTPISSSSSGYGLQSSTARGGVDAEDIYVGVVPFSGTNYWDDRVCQYTNASWGCTGTNGLKSEYATNGASYSGEPYPYVYRSNMSSTAPTFYTSGNLKYIQNNGYTIAYYVENYLTKLKNEKGLPSTATAKLLSYEEAQTFRNIVYYDLNVAQCNIGGTQLAMQAYNLDETTAAGMASILCSGGDLDGTTLEDMLIEGSLTPEYYNLMGLSNVDFAINKLSNTTFWLGSAYDHADVWHVNSYDGIGGYDFKNNIINGVRPVIVISTSDISV